MTVESTSRSLESPAHTPPLGAHHDGTGATFALYSSVADALELCLFGESGEETRWSLIQGDGGVWQGYLPTARPGQRYGYRVHGPWDPAAGPPDGGLDLLRGARQGFHEAPRRRPGAPGRHLRGLRAPSRDRAPETARR